MESTLCASLKDIRRQAITDKSRRTERSIYRLWARAITPRADADLACYLLFHWLQVNEVMILQAFFT